MESNGQLVLMRAQMREEMILDYLMEKAKVTKFKPDKNVGSGIPIDLYKLKDGSSVKIGWSNGKVLYVTHGDKALVE